jgi:hypothetical protein
MDKFFFIVSDYVNGKVVYPPIRRILNFLFSASITSFLFQTFYFKYDWLDLDYKSILDFLVKGDFFIPFSLFLVVHFGLFFLSSLAFNLTMTRKSNRVLSNILKYQLKKKHIKSFKKSLKNNLVAPVHIDDETWIRIYDHVKNSVTKEQWEELEKMLVEKKQLIEPNFNLICKLMVVVSIYFITIPHFGWLLYALVLLFSLLGLICLWWLHLGLDVFPAAVRKFNTEVQKYLQSNQLIQTEQPAYQK